MERRIKILDRHDATLAYAPIKRAKKKLYLKKYYSENKEAQLERNRKPEYRAKQKEYLKGYLKEYMKKYRPEYRRRKREERQKEAAERAQKEDQGQTPDTNTAN